MEKLSHKDLLDAGVHFGHLKKKWNPKMLPYIFMEKKGIHIIDLYKTLDKLDEAAFALKNIAKSGKKILFVATKKQAKGIVEKCAQQVGMPYVTERWLGGMLTNFATIRKSIKKMQAIEKMLGDGSYENITKKERLVLSRERDKLNRVLGGIAQLNRIPAAIFVVDISHEHIAISEAHKLNMTSFGMVDSNSDPTTIDFPIPANDDASKSVSIIAKYITAAIQEGLDERKNDKEQMEAAKVAEEEESTDEIEVEDIDEKEKAAKKAEASAESEEETVTKAARKPAAKPAAKKTVAKKVKR